MVEDEVSTVHDPKQILVPLPRPPRCLRHRVVMAACDDCRAALTARAIDRRRKAAPAG